MSIFTTFTLFPSLPIEIRLKVYSIILSVPRIVSLVCIKESPERGPHAIKSFTSPSPIPALLHVNRESRHEALAVYTAHFKNPSAPCATYLNFSLDTVKFADGVLPYVVSALPWELNLIELMALETKDCYYFGLYNMEFLKRMQRLKVLEITAWRGASFSLGAGWTFMEYILRDFEEARKEDPGWVFPIVRVLNGETGELGGVVEGGSLLEECTIETAHPFEQAATT